MAIWKSRLHSWGYDPVFCSVETKDGIKTLQFNLREQTTVIVGPSGVGKSSLINTMRSNKRTFVEEDYCFDPVNYPSLMAITYAVKIFRTCSKFFIICFSPITYSDSGQQLVCRTAGWESVVKKWKRKTHYKTCLFATHIWWGIPC